MLTTRPPVDVIVAPVYGEAEKQWAYGAVGTLLGFWLGVTSPGSEGEVYRWRPCKSNNWRKTSSWHG
jgi:hypothetical protein